MEKFPARAVKEFAVFKRLNTPHKIQDFLDTFTFNFEPQGETCSSPLAVLRRGSAHCIEGAMLAGAILWAHGQKPLLLDLKTTKNDLEHVVALFQKGKLWGAFSKTNTATLRYRDPVYASPRELAMSYFNEYFLDNGKKTMRSYSAPFSLLAYENDWLTSNEDLWAIPEDLDASPHFPIVSVKDARKLRPVHRLEIKAGKLTEERD